MTALQHDATTLHRGPSDARARQPAASRRCQLHSIPVAASGTTAAELTEEISSERLIQLIVGLDV